jgi:hypothetical protein
MPGSTRTCLPILLALLAAAAVGATQAQADAIPVRLGSSTAAPVQGEVVTAAVERLTQRRAVRYVYWMIADRFDIPRHRLNAHDQQFRVRAECTRRISRQAYACSFHGGCCDEFIRGKGHVSEDPRGRDARWRWRFRVAQGYRERVMSRRTWVGSARR